MVEKKDLPANVSDEMTDMHHTMREGGNLAKKTTCNFLPLVSILPYRLLLAHA